MSISKIKSCLKVLYYIFVGSEGTPDSVKPSVVDEEEGLPSPPMDEGAFFAAQTGSMELSQVPTCPFSPFILFTFFRVLIIRN